ncbi:ADP-ribosylglycohydrolase family protein [Saccharopolyspora sp. NPDC050389]|uniref:ADP-ribosylglycohydrolase family protein n=1 Tax=Saccharopolyspora sp. NPDC050389 TaxID=3155516 RepID=UPI0033E5320F
MNSTGSPPAHDRARGLFTGVGLGDAMGAAFEGKPSVTELTLREFEHSNHQLRYTDNTVLTIAVAEHLLERASHGGHLLDEGELAAALTCAWTREPWRGFTSSAAEMFERHNSGMPWRDAAVSLFHGQSSFGNGGAMRCTPVALAAQSAHHAAELGRRTASVTHTHPDGQEGAAVQACSAYLALHDCGRLDPESFLDKLAHEIHEPEWVRRLHAVAAQLGHRDPHRAAEALGNDVRATHSVPLALWAFLAHVEAPADVVRQCIRAGGDTGTIASMAAALAGALRGAAGWPQSWLRRIEGLPRLHDLGDRLARLSA